MSKIDSVDHKILRALQHNARLSSSELAEEVSLTTSPCWRRFKQLEEAGVIVSKDVTTFGDYAKTHINGLPYVKEVYKSFVLDEIKSEVAPPF